MSLLAGHRMRSAAALWILGAAAYFAAEVLAAAVAEVGIPLLINASAVGFYGDTRNPFEIDSSRRWTHVRLTIYPDGGVARLRVHGEGLPDSKLVGFGPTDLAALENGGLVLDCSNRFYSSPQNIIFPGLAQVMGDGWETARRRDDGNDWVHIRLAGAGHIRLAEVDTSYFIGNSPGAAALWGRRDGSEWVQLLPRTDLLPDTRHRFPVAGDDVVDQVRLDIFPDGGLARLRLFGELV